MGKAMFYYRTGNVRKGLDDLNRLYEVGTKNKIDLGLLLGQVYFEQGAYLTASGYFRKAAMQGMKNAWYWYAVSCLDAGNQQEAAWAFREALPYLSKSDKIRVTILADGLGSGQFHNAAQRSDPEKSAFIKINWSKIGEQQLKDLIHLTGDKEAQRFLWKYCFDKAYRENRNFRFQDLYRYAVRFHGKDKKWQDQIRQAKPLVLEASSKFEELEKCNKDGFGQFVLGRLAESKKDSVEAIKFFNSTLQEAPLNNRQAIYSVLALEKYGQRDQAYQKSLELSQLDPNNAAYLKLFAGLAIRSGLVEFAFQTLPRIEILTSKAEAEAFRKYLETELKAKNFPLPENIIP
jgi:Flp pilus assembly protein TadD